MKCEFPACEEEAANVVGGVHCCALHEDWAIQVCDDAEIKDYDWLDY